MAKKYFCAFRVTVLSLTALALGCSLQAAFQLKVELSPAFIPGPVTVSRKSLEEGTSVPVVTAPAHAGRIDLTVDAGPGLFEVQFGEMTTSFVAADGQVIELTLSPESKSPGVAGGRDQELYLNYEAFRTESLARLVTPVREAIRVAQAAGNATDVVRLTEQEIAAYLAHRRELNDFTLAHLRNSASLYAASLRWDGDYRLEELAAAVQEYSRQFPAAEIARLMEQRIDRYHATAIGAVAPALSGTTPTGSNLKLADLRGRYVLVDFWASWCAPCRIENQHYVELHRRHHTAGFEILAVSVDQNERAWKAAIATDHAGWLHISDLTGWKTPLAGAYNVSALPASFLLDPEGRIVAKNLRGKQLDDRLATLLPQSK